MARMIDADAMLAELKPITYEMEHTSVLVSDMSKIMRKWVERQPTLTQPNEGAKDKNVPTNEPLTLEELREMDEQPVWVEELNRWALVDLMYSRGDELIMVLFDDGDIEVRNVKLCNLHCYRRPPEGEEEEKHVIEITENL